MQTLRFEIERPHSGQQQVITDSKRFNVLQCGRRYGKTTLGINRLIDNAVRGGRGAWFAPTYKLLADVWRQMLATLSSINPIINVQEKRIELITSGSIEFWSLDQPDAGRGRKYHLVVVDEAGIVRNLSDAWLGAIRPTLTDFKGGAWFLGTPKGRNFFHQLYAKGQANDPEWASWRMPTTANPHIDPAEVEAARGDMPPAVFNQEYLGIPADDGGNPFGLDSINACKKPLSQRDPVAFGVDLAKSVDWTVVIGLDESGDVCVAERWQSDWGQTRRRILEMIGSTPTLVDSTGVGDPIVEDLCRGSTGVIGFKFSSTSKQQIMEGLAGAIQQREIGFPSGWLTAELENFEYEYVGGRVRYSAPEGLHDDGVCALALANRCRIEHKPVLVPEFNFRIG